jgi:uncharacterized protein (DUF1810 family)
LSYHVRVQDPYDLKRFVDAQASVYPQVLTELRAGKKRSHWMWFIFPQVAGLGMSSTSRHYAIQSLNEARAYLDHPMLGPRLVECCEALLALDGRTASEIFGYPDDMKLRSSMTLFAAVPGSPVVLRAVLDKYFAGKPDERTLGLIDASRSDLLPEYRVNSE